MNVEEGFQLPDLRGMIRRRAKPALAVALLVSVAAFWLAMALPNEYESYATVLVEPQAVDPSLVEAGVPQSDLNRRLHLMAAQILSRPRLSRIIDELGLYDDESKYLVREEVINMMREQIRVEPVVPELQGPGPAPRNFEIDQFRIFFSDDDPVVARDVAQRLANDFIKEHIASRVRVSQKSLEFIEAEQERLAGAIRRVEAQVAEVRAANPGKLPEDIPANQRRLERINAELAAARREAAAARSDEAFFRSQSATARELMGSANMEQNTPRSRIRVLELQLANMESRGYTAKHPDMLNARQELEALRTQIQQEQGLGTGSFAEQNADAEADRARLRRLSAEEEIGRLDVMADQANQLLIGAPPVAEQLDGLLREYRHLFESYQDFSQRRLEAGVQADLERRQLGEQFRVLESAFLAPAPTSPNRQVIIAIGMLFGVALGAGIAIVLEAADGSVHTARQLQASLNIPVLASIPEIWLEQDRVRLRRSRIRTAAAMTAVLVFGVAGGMANYWWVNVAGSRKDAEAEQPFAQPGNERVGAAGGP